MTKNILILTSVTAAAVVGLVFLALGATHALAGPAAQSSAPELISFQGYLSDDAGRPISGTVDLQFGLYDAPSGGNPLWEETQGAIPVADGYFAVLLGSTNPLSAALFDAPTRFLEVRVDAGDGQVTLPRQGLASVPYAFQAQNADTVDGLDASAFWGVTGNAGTLPGTHFLGTRDATSLTLAVSGTAALRLIPNSLSPNLIGGYGGNSVTAGVTAAVIGGGGTADIGDGNPLPNRVTDHYGVVAGGVGNRAGDDAGTLDDAAGATVGGGGYNEADGGVSTIGGGSLNVASGFLATIGGGSRNNVTDTLGTIGGGSRNQVLGYAGTVAGGQGNTASGDHATVGGGHLNHADALTATIGGGEYISVTGNAATVAGGSHITVTHPYATVGGGSRNQVLGYAGTVAGGWDNTVARYATVGGGANNTASDIWATVGGGTINTASSAAATVGGGGGNTASSSLATVGGGGNNTASGILATIPGGASANASHYGEMAYASGPFASAGDAQTSLYVLRNQTGDSTPTELFLNGSFERLAVASNRVVTFDILVVAAHRYGGSSAGYQITGVIKNMGGATSFVWAPIKTVLGEDNASWDVDVIANDTNDALVIQVTGSNATTIRWVAMVHTVEVSR